MAMRGNLDNWRNFFGFSHFNIFDIIDNAILVAASDYPQEFNLRKNRIAQTLISPTLTPVVDEEEGLPSPPWDEGDLFATQTTSIDLSEFFDGMDDHGNPQNSENERPSTSSQNVPKPKPQILSGSYVPAKDKKSEEMKKEQPGINNQFAVVKPNNCLKAESGPARQTKVDARQKVRNETEFQQKLDKTTIQKKPLAAQQDKLKCLDNTAKLEAAKRAPRALSRC